MTTAQQQFDDWFTAHQKRPVAAERDIFDLAIAFGRLAKPIIVFALMVAGGLAMGGLFIGGDTKPPRPNYNAQIAQAQEFVRAGLKSPASASFPWTDYKVYDLGGDKWIVSSYVDAQNGFGANIRTRWAVVMQNGKLLNLECNQ